MRFSVVLVAAVAVGGARHGGWSVSTACGAVCVMAALVSA